MSTDTRGDVHPQTKGCGSAVMENKAAWHHKVPTPEEAGQIMRDLDARKEALS